MKPEEHIIVIGRQYGSGGRQLGKLLAESLGMSYYDKELLREASDRLGFRADLFERADEKRPSRFMSMVGATYGASTYFTSGAMNGGTLYKMQSDVIRNLLEKGPCVIVGRTADYIGRDLPNLVSIFLCAGKEERVRRTLERNPLLKAEDVNDWLDRKDSERAAYYNYYTGRKWGHADNYDLCLNTTGLTTEQTCEIVKLLLVHRQ